MGGNVISKEIKIKSWHIQILTIGILIIILILMIYENIKTKSLHKIELNNQRKTLTYVKDSFVDDMLLPDNQVAMKYKTIYSRYINIFSSKYRSRSMNKTQIANFCYLAYKYTKKFNFPKYYFIAVALMESCFNPHLEGPCKELGITQQHPTVMGVVYWALNDLQTMGLIEEAKELRPRIKSHKDLRGNPIASLKCQILIAWQSKNYFGDNVAWWVSDAHWGSVYNLRKLWKKNESTKMTVVFYRKNKKGKWKLNDTRNPMTYYQFWQSIHDKLSLGRVDVWREIKRELKGYKKYIDRCSKAERKFIMSKRDALKLQSKVIRQEIRIEKQQKELNKLKKENINIKVLAMSLGEDLKISRKKWLRKKNYDKLFASQDGIIKAFLRKFGKKILKKL